MKKKVKLLEAQYEKLKQDVSEALAKNKHSEQEISKIRLERVTINRLREKLEKELQEKAQEYIEVNKESENVWNEKKNAQNLLRDLQVQSQREEEFAEIEFQNQMIARDYKMNRSKSQEKNLAQSMSSFGTKSRLTQKVHKEKLIFRSHHFKIRTFIWTHRKKIKPRVRHLHQMNLLELKQKRLQGKNLMKKNWLNSSKRYSSIAGLISVLILMKRSKTTGKYFRDWRL